MTIRMKKRAEKRTKRGEERRRGGEDSSLKPDLAITDSQSGDDVVSGCRDLFHSHINAPELLIASFAVR